MGKRVGIMQPYFFPYLGYFQLLYAVDSFIFLDDADFIKRGWINRNRILLNGEAHLISIPLVKASQNRPINSIELSSSSKWKKDFYKKIEHAYKKAPYFEQVRSILENVIDSGVERIDGLAMKSCQEVLSYLDISIEIFCSSSLDPKREKKGEERLINLCLMLNGDDYINPINGKKLYDPVTFREQGIQLNFLTSGMPPYEQFGNEFIPGLSMIDVLMFNSKEEVLDMLRDYDLEDAHSERSAS
jgi:hypothetical protein